MDAEKTLRQEVKKYIDATDIKVVKMAHAMLEVDARNDNDWWDSMPDSVKADVEAALEKFENGQTAPHSEIIKRSQQWIVK